MKDWKDQLYKSGIDKSSTFDLKKNPMIKKPTQKHLATFRLSKDCRDKLKQLAEEQKISQASIIEKLVKNEKL